MFFYRYVEFNLVYDCGIKFGFYILEVCIESILMFLFLEVCWEYMYVFEKGSKEEKFL